jgi:hypothetical protein
VSKPLFRFVERSEVAITRPAMEKAHWRCEMCPATEALRVVQFFRGDVVQVLCRRCQMRVGWPKALPL